MVLNDVKNIRTVVAIDPGTRCGWAVRDNYGRMVNAGTWDLSGSRFEGAGMRFLRFRKFLADVLDVSHPLCVVYEEVRGHKGVDAAHIYGGLVAVLTEECESRQLPYSGIPVGTVKKFATGKGNSGKPAMMEAAGNKWPDFDGDDNEADARWIAECHASDLGFNKPLVYDIG